VETYYDNGALETVVRYSDNQRIDTAERYYKNGTLKEREVYLKPPEGKGDPLQADLYKRLIYYADSMGNIHVQDGNGQAEIIYNNDDIERGRNVDGRREVRSEGTIQKAKYGMEEWNEDGDEITGTTTDSLGKQDAYEHRQVQTE